VTKIIIGGGGSATVTRGRKARPESSSLTCMSLPLLGNYSGLMVLTPLNSRGGFGRGRGGNAPPAGQ
jgi:hypothetical protein